MENHPISAGLEASATSPDIAVAIPVAPPPKTTLSSRRTATSYRPDTRYHLRSLLLNLVLLIPIIIASIGAPPVLALFFPLLFLYFIDAFFYSSTLDMLRNEILTPVESKSFMRALQLAAPRIKMKVSCFHTERVIRTRRVTDSDGNAHTERYTKWVKVETFAADRDRTFRSWADTSGDLPSVFSLQNLRQDLQRSGVGETKTDADLEASQFPPGKDEQSVDVLVPKSRVLKVMLSSSYEAYDAATEDHLLNEEKMFKAKHCMRDKQMAFKEELLIPGYQPSIMIVEGKRPSQLTQFWYCFWTMLLCSWAYRMWVESQISRVEWHLKKVVSIGDLQGEIERDSSAPIVRSDTLRFVSAFDGSVPIAVPVPQENDATASSVALAV